MPEIDGTDVSFGEAIEFFRRKLRIPTAHWTDLWEDMHAAAFVIAGAQADAMLKDFFTALEKALQEGTTLEEFRKEFDRIVARYGWSYHGSAGWRSKLIFQVNLRMAYAAGRWEQIQRLKGTRPYLRYVHVDPDLKQENSRPEHAAWHDTVLPVDHPWWRTHYPPNGWNCRCYVQSLSERDLARYKLTVSEAPAIVLVTHVVNTPQGPMVVEVPEGIDPGFAYNVGIAGLAARPEPQPAS